MALKIGPAIAAALGTSPLGPAAGAICFFATTSTEQYEKELSNNAWVRTLGHSVVDPSWSEFLWNQALPAAGTVFLFALILSVFINLVVGVPVVLLVMRLFTRSAGLQLTVPTILGAALGTYLWDELSQGLPFSLWRNSPGLVTGGFAALAMALAARRWARDWDKA